MKSSQAFSKTTRNMPSPTAGMSICASSQTRSFASGRISKSAVRNAKALPSVCKGQYGFSGQKHRKAVLSSLPGRFCSRKTPQDLPAGKNQGWQGRRTKVGLISHQGRERSQRSFWLLLAYCPLYTEGAIKYFTHSPAACLLCENDFFLHNLHCTSTYVIVSRLPLAVISCYQIFLPLFLPL